MLFQSTVFRLPGNNLTAVAGDSTSTQVTMPVLLSTSQTSVPSDANGLASVVPSVKPFTGLLELVIQVSAGTSAALQAIMEAFPEISSTEISGTNSSAPAATQWYGILPDPSGVETNSPITDDPPSDTQPDDR